MTASKSIEIDLMHLANPKLAGLLQRFFKTGPGEYGEGDRFLGIKVPVTRSIVKKYQNEAYIEDALRLLDSPWHECRFAGTVLLVHQYRTGTEEDRRLIYKAFLKHPGLNNWDLIDFSTPRIVGVHLMHRNRTDLDTLMTSRSVWKRRIAIVATLWFIHEGKLETTFDYCDRLINDQHDLIHKACGWALREAGKKDRRMLEQYLDRRAAIMPRTMLRYAIEKLPERKRKVYLMQKSEKK